MYNLDDDPSERTNRYAGDRAVADDLDAELSRDLDKLRSGATPQESAVAPVDQASLDRLASLGYARRAAAR